MEKKRTGNGKEQAIWERGKGKPVLISRVIITRSSALISLTYQKWGGGAESIWKRRADKRKKGEGC